jgi:Ca2+-binding EF-hand superfamily protein
LNSLDDEVRDLFKSVDENGNGHLEPNELHKALVDIGINPGHDELLHYFKMFDKDGDNTISYDEFSSIIKDFLRKEMSQANDFLSELRKEFKAADTNNTRCLKPN